MLLQRLLTAATNSRNALELSSEQMTALFGLARAAQHSAETDEEALDSDGMEDTRRLLDELESGDLKKAFARFCAEHGVQLDTKED